MLSRRDKLLIQPWEERRFKDHKSKVSSALPAIDARAPAPRPHVARNLKLQQREADRALRIQRDNFSLLQRLTAIMSAKRLDNKWTKPLPDFHHRVGLFYKPQSVAARVCARAASPPPPARTHVKCYACHIKKKTSSAQLYKSYESSTSDIENLPSISSTRTNGN